MSAAKQKDKEEAFEPLLERLETLIEGMEAGDVPLDQLVNQYEEGTQLLKRCQAYLKDAQLKISQLKAGSDSLEPLDFPN
tara:strand:+ start:21752 stop:21991 length:240 start_codon:yes stop_codon:yes gene_type:complete